MAILTSSQICDGFSEWVKQLEFEADHSSISNVVAKNDEAILPLPHIPSWHSA
jgi:hypothetical protein